MEIQNLKKNPQFVALVYVHRAAIKVTTLQHLHSILYLNKCKNKLVNDVKLAQVVTLSGFSPQWHFAFRLTLELKAGLCLPLQGRKQQKST